MHDSQLITELRDSACGIHSAQHPFPEPPPGGQDRVVGDHDFFVIVAVFQLGATQVPGDFTEVFPECLLHDRYGRGFLGEDDLADHAIDIGIGQWDGNGETPHQFLQIWHAGKCHLAGPDEQQASGKALAAGLSDFLYPVDLLDIITDILLDFVHHDEREWEFAIDRQGVLHVGDHFVIGHIGYRGELSLEQLADFLGTGCKLRIDLEQALRQYRRYIEVWQFGLQILAR